IDTNEQVRHMPIAMALVVKEENIPDVLAAFMNSKLRIQVTQFHWQHCRDSIQPVVHEAPPPSEARPVAQAQPGGGGRRGGRGEGGGRGEAVRERRGSTGGGRLRGEGGRGEGGREGGGPGLRMGAAQTSGSIFGGQTGTGEASVDQEEDMSLMDVSIYGIASLYEKYPPKPATESTTPAVEPAK